ncbi:YfbM family protein [Kitasatospora sp. NBC_00240]|uniref:YfbM family protein n=1 Tax=Kitasatospora sp. NBC_00240 TaxID=2903567 RepID=UPI0022538464|nr:YfbM family protein [Kitasatospora sp. NBC_00240]MCX5208526.1 YfbM family protein [Kitasatospora sp. NBC_00240]
MGMYVSFTRMTPAQLEQAAHDPDWAAEYLDAYYGDGGPCDLSGGLDKAWAGLQFLLDAAEVPVEFLMDGFPIRDDGTLFGWSAEDVRELAKELRAVPFERLAAHYDPARMAAEGVYPNVWEFRPEEELDHLRGSYESLVGFLDSAAASGSAAVMTFG